MWDTKRQSFGSWSASRSAPSSSIRTRRDEFGRFDGTVFVFWEIILLAIIATLFYLYSRKKKGDP
jgi:hypothetical protein